MAIDQEVENAVRELAKELGQPDKLANRLISWLKDLSERELTVEEEHQHLETLKKAVDVKATDSR